MPGHRVTRHFVTVGPRQVHYRRLGSGPPVLLVHETPMTGAMLLPLAQKLADRYTVIALDTPGYGISDKLPEPEYPMIPEYADALAEVIPALGLDRSHVYGSHTGANIVLELGYRQPRVCRSLVIDGLPIFTRPDAVDLMLNNIPFFSPRRDGTHLVSLWHRYRDHNMFWPWYRLRGDVRLEVDLPTPRWLQERVLEWLLPGDDYAKSYHAAFRYEVEDALAGIRPRAAITGHWQDLLGWHMERLPQRLRKNIVTARMPPAEHASWIADFLAGDPAPEAPPPPETVPVPGRVSRTYASDGQRQVYVRRRTDAGGRPLVLLPAAPDSGSGLLPLLRELGETRSVAAFDTPGNGGSDPLRAREPAVADYVASLERAIRSLDWREVDLYGKGAGAVLALELALAHPRLVRGVVLDGFPLYPRDVRRRFVEREPVSLEPEQDGSHLIRAWTMVRDHEIFFPWFDTRKPAIRNLDISPPEEIHRRTLEVLKAQDTYHLAERAALAHPLEERLAVLERPALAVARDDDVAAPFLGEVGRIAGIDTAVLPREPAAAAAVIGGYLDRLPGGWSASASHPARRARSTSATR